MKLRISLAILSILLILPIACRRSDDTEARTLPVVTVSQAEQRPVLPFLELTGTASASQSVDLVARVPGYLQSVNFADGSWVEQGELLFVIEPEPYEQQLAIAQAQLLRAQSELDRQRALAEQDATSVADVERWQSQRDQATAQVALAKLNLDYTRVTAPFSGRIGRHLVDPGNMVGVDGNTKLATLEQLVPIYIYFNVNERDALNIRAQMKKIGLDPETSVGKVTVEAGLQNESGYPHSGTLNFVDSTSSNSTGTIQLRGEFANEEKTMVPGLFTRVRVPVGEPEPMLVLPGSAVGNDQQGDYVLVVDDQDEVARKTVTKGPLVDGGVAIANGISPKDRVIVNGSVHVRLGDKVTVRSGAASTGPAASPAP